MFQTLMLAAFLAAGIGTPDTGITHPLQTATVRTSVQKRDTSDNDYDASAFIRRFYEEYAAALTADDRDKAADVARRYISPKLMQRLQMSELDYDPFLQAQDYDAGTLDNMRIVKQAASADEYIYKVYLWDAYNKLYNHVNLVLKRTEEDYTIDDIAVSDK